MYRHRHPTVALCLVLAACGQPAGDSDTTDAPPEASTPAATAPAAAPTTPEGKITSATSAAPSEISAQAAVMDMDASGKMTELRAGTNGWMCVPDGSVTPGVDPMCADKGAQEWLTAYFGQKAPPATAMGIAYMLAGGSDASNTDPYAQQPAPGDEWIASGPHIMVLPPDPALLSAFPTDPKNGGPYVMWQGTPYAHLMVPVGHEPH
jgi:hypothetical protein